MPFPPFSSSGRLILTHVSASYFTPSFLTDLPQFLFFLSAQPLGRLLSTIFSITNLLSPVFRLDFISFIALEIHLYPLL